MAEAKSKTRCGKEFKKGNEDEDLEEFAPVLKEKDSSKEIKLKTEESDVSDFIKLTSLWYNKSRKENKNEQNKKKDMKEKREKKRKDMRGIEGKKDCRKKVVKKENG